MSELGWPTAARLEFGTLDGIIGCVAADMGVTLLPRAVAQRSDQAGMVRMHTLNGQHRRVETLFIRRRAAHGCLGDSGHAALFAVPKGGGRDSRPDAYDVVLGMETYRPLRDDGDRYSFQAPRFSRIPRQVAPSGDGTALPDR